MTDHPLGDHTVIRDGLGEALAEYGTPDLTAEKSISTTRFNLDDFMSGDVRRAEKTARFCTRPDLEAEIEDLHNEFDSLTDIQGRPLPVVDQAADDSRRSADAVRLEIAEKQREYAVAMRTIRMRAMDEDDWAAFQERHKKAIAEGDYPPEYWVELIVKSAVDPMFTTEQVQAFRSRVGHAIYSDIANVAYRVNMVSGLSIPKSLPSSGVLRV